ncbi:hypothetical protein SEA_TAQUITO_76 [Mycobacterium phage Taquito]|uniref:Uncharacterized protein n=1 Tax=Mycobacterium phage Taquito TaxID=1897500 RepID=A0A1D8EQ84_9CAUD|nr:hypothetical protein I5G70_gp57 [Mycobacterium phage Taquito]AOT23196.1 hypothetical protein SEA_TAQUITO_76 [Mycobacterium phage Taquito]
MTDELTLTDDEREAAEAAVDKVLDKVVVSADVVLDAALDAINARRRSETDQPVGTIVRHKRTGQLAEVVEDQGVRRFRPLQRAPLGVGVTVDDSSDWQTVFKPGHETLLLKDDDEAGEYAEGTVVDAVGFMGIPALPLDGVPGTFRDRDGDLYRHRNGRWQFADRGARLWAELGDAPGDVDMLRNFGPYRRVQLVK